jgi:hypothetical protein
MHLLFVNSTVRSFREIRKFCICPPAKNVPPFLYENPDISANITEYAKENLDTLSIEMLAEYIHDKILPQLVIDVFDETEESVSAMPKERYNSQLRLILSQYGLTCVSPSTVYRWMTSLGFRYEPCQKGYYVDGHERPATIQYRWDFCKRYLAYEQRMQRWIQVPATLAIELETKGEVAKGSGYKYDSNGVSMFEYHVDSFAADNELLKEMVTTSLGGNLSVQFPQGSKPLIIFGHDECIFKQFLMPGKQWYGPNRETYVVPKDDGMGVMISAFQSREFGFGLNLTKEDLVKVNQQRVGRYCDKETAIDKQKSATRQHLPHCRSFVSMNMKRI